MAAPDKDLIRQEPGFKPEDSIGRCEGQVKQGDALVVRDGVLEPDLPSGPGSQPVDVEAALRERKSQRWEKAPWIEKIAERVRRHFKLGEYGEMRRAEEEQTPIFMMVGSLTDCSYKDAVSYVKGLAEHYVMGVDAAWYRIFEDRPNGRYVYEIQDGGPGLSALEKILVGLRDGPVHIRLANQGYVTIEQEHGSICSLVVSDEQGVYPTQTGRPVQPRRIAHYLESGKKLKELYPKSTAMTTVGSAILSISLVTFAIAGAAYIAVSSGYFEDDLFKLEHRQQAVAQVNENPMLQLEQAKTQSTAADMRIQRLEYKNGKWSWALAPLSTAQAPLPTSSSPVPADSADASPGPVPVQRPVREPRAPR